MAAVAKLGWKVLGVATGLAAAKATRKALDVGWSKTRGGEPPRNPASRETDWSEAIAWAVASGIALGLARAGGRVALLDRDEAGSAETLRHIQEAGADRRLGR